MTDQGKPSVCPVCGSPAPSERWCSDYAGSPRPEGGRLVPHVWEPELGCTPCTDPWHSSPVPAATTETELLEKAARKVVATFSDENIAAGLAFVMRDFGDEAKVSAPQAVPAATLPPHIEANLRQLKDVSAPQAESVPAGKDAAREWLENNYPNHAASSEGIDTLPAMLSEYAASETAALRAERDKLIEMVRKLCDSMVPHPKEHPTMYAAKLEAQKVLGSVKLECEIKELRKGRQ